MYSVFEGDCLELLEAMPSDCVDLVVMDPPYEINGGKSGGCFGREARAYHNQIYDTGLDQGISNDVLEQLVRVMKKINIYIFCNKTQLRQYINFFEDRGATTELLTWHKGNPVPTCNNKYLSDTEYILFFREKGVNIYGEYATKHKYYITPTNKSDKKIWKHPTVKPEPIIHNFIVNSSLEGQVVLDPYMGTGTTGAVAVELDRKFIGMEIDPHWAEIARNRIEGVKNVLKQTSES